MTFFRAVTKIAINNLGYDIRRVAKPHEAEIAAAGSDPITFEYVRNRRGHMFFEINLGELRAFHALALPLTPHFHPFVRAVQSARAERQDAGARAAAARVLRTYYEEARSTGAADIYGVPLAQLPRINCVPLGLDRCFTEIAFLPWTDSSPGEILEERRRTAIFEGLQSRTLGRPTDGVTGVGPVKEAKLELEVERIVRLTTSIAARGFLRLDRRTPLQVSALRRAGDYRWMINSGQHRFAAAAAFGIGSVPAMVTQVVRREDAAYWPQVVAGTFTKEGAEAVFDRIFDARPAPVCKAWIERLSGPRDQRLNALG